MSEYAKHIQRIEDMWKKRIELREGVCEQMNEYTRREMEYRAEQIAHEAQKRLARMEHIVNGLGEVKGEIVRCRDCTNKQPYDEPMGCDCLCGLFWIEVEPDGFCAWGERR